MSLVVDLILFGFLFNVVDLVADDSSKMLLRVEQATWTRLAVRRATCKLPDQRDEDDAKDSRRHHSRSQERENL